MFLNLLSSFVESFVMCIVSDTSTQAVSVFAIQVRFTAASATNCVMLGDNTNTNCIHQFDWPTENTDVATNGATTSSRTHVESAEYNKGLGDYTVSV